jgi:hypothetical protein
MQTNKERQQLENEYARMKRGAGRTMAERSRKLEVEARMEQLQADSGRLKLQLRAKPQ